jgi:Tfp pilus assembly protein PilO
MREIKKKNNWSLLSLLLVIVSISIGYFIINPHINDIRDIDTRVLAKIEENNQLENKLTALQKLKVDFEENQQTVKLLDLSLPEENMMAEIVESIGAMANDSVFKLTSIKQSKSRGKGETTVEISFEGSYFSLKLFMENLEKYIRLVKPVRINVNEMKNTDGGESFLRGSMTLNFFRVDNSEKYESTSADETDKKIEEEI